MGAGGPDESDAQGGTSLHEAGPGDRGVSEFTGVAILILVTVIATASVGLSVLVADETAGGPPDANFTFQYIDGSSVLVVTFDRGDPIAAGNLTVRGQATEASWAALAGAEPSTMVGPATPDSTIQLSRRNAYGERIAADDTIRILYTPTVGNETLLQRWDGR